MQNSTKANKGKEGLKNQSNSRVLHPLFVAFVPFCKKEILSVLALVFFFAGCDNPQHTADTLRKEITSFQTAPTEEKKISIDAHFAKLENQIDALEKQGKEEEASNLTSQRINLQGDYQAAKMAKALNDAKNAVQGFGEAVKDGAQSIGDLFKKSGTNSE